MFIDRKDAKLLKSLWLADLRRPASTIRDTVLIKIDANIGIVVLELSAGLDWATASTYTERNVWLEGRPL